MYDHSNLSIEHLIFYAKHTTLSLFSIFNSTLFPCKSSATETELSSVRPHITITVLTAIQATFLFTEKPNCPRVALALECDLL